MNPNIERLKSITSGETNFKGYSFFKSVNASFSKIERGTLEGSFVVTEEFLNGNGVMHGGVISGIVDECAGLSAYTYGIKAKTPTISLTTNYLAPLHLHAVVHFYGHVIKMGKRVIYAEVEFKIHEKVVIRGSGNYAVLETDDHKPPKNPDL